MRDDPLSRWNLLGGTLGNFYDSSPPKARRRVGAKLNGVRQAEVWRLSDDGMRRQEIAARLQLSLGSVDHYLNDLRAMRASPNTIDATVPKFARHAECVAAVMAHGGFPRLSERPSGAAGFPLIYPEAPR